VNLLIPLTASLNPSSNANYETKNETRASSHFVRCLSARSPLQVARYSALVFGIIYGIVHQSTLQAKYDENKVRSFGFGSRIAMAVWDGRRGGVGMRNGWGDATSADQVPRESNRQTHRKHHLSTSTSQHRSTHPLSTRRALDPVVQIAKQETNARSFL
jgi:hypothetical protein